MGRGRGSVFQRCSRVLDGKACAGPHRGGEDRVDGVVDLCRVFRRMITAMVLLMISVHARAVAVLMMNSAPPRM